MTAPMPSNYDHVVELLDENYGGYLTEIANLNSSLLSNKVANQLFAKTLEPGFNYENAVNEGGLVARDLYNAIIAIMMSLASDHSRIPIIQTNILVCINGKLSSYNAFDSATHFFKHGVITAMALTCNEFYNNQGNGNGNQNGDSRMTNMIKSHTNIKHI